MTTSRMTAPRTTIVTLALVAAMAAGVTGCSNDSAKETPAATNAQSKTTSPAPESTTPQKKAPTAEEAWSKAQDRLGTYTSLTMDASGKNEGKLLHMTVRGAVDGKTQQVTAEQGAARFELITVGGKSYMKANDAYLATAGGTTPDATDKAMQKAMKGRWVQMPAGSRSEEDTAFAGGMIKDMRDDSDEDSKKLLSKDATVTADEVNGKEAWKISSKDKSLNAWVSADDKYDVLKVTGAGGKDAMSTMIFSDPNAKVDITKPAGAKNLAELIKAQ